jgi:hypothetical protein
LGSQVVGRRSDVLTHPLQDCSGESRRAQQLRVSVGLVQAPAINHIPTSTPLAGLGFSQSPVGCVPTAFGRPLTRLQGRRRWVTVPGGSWLAGKRAAEARAPSVAPAAPREPKEGRAQRYTGCLVPKCGLGPHTYPPPSQVISRKRPACGGLSAVGNNGVHRHAR